MEQAQRYCEDCGRHVLAERQPLNHLLHAVLSLVGCGCWLPIWALLYLTHDPPWRCQRCGAPTVRDEPPRARRRPKIPRDAGAPRPKWHVTVNTRAPKWPAVCACCLRPADRNLPVVATRGEGVEVVREKTMTAAVPYCTPCMDHLKRRPEILRLADDVEADQERADAEEANARAAASQAARRAPVPTAILTLMASSALAGLGLVLFVLIGSRGNVLAGIGTFLGLVTLALGAGALAWFQLRERDRLAGERIAEQARRLGVEVDQVAARSRDRMAQLRAETERARLRLLACPQCASEYEAVTYIGWKGNFHSFGFRNHSYAEMFVQANAGKVIG